MAVLMAFRDGEASPREHARVEHHLRHCPSCQATFASIELGIGTFESVTRKADIADGRVEMGLLQLQDAIESRTTQGRNGQNVHYWFELPDHILTPVRAELEIYLGRRAAMQFLGKAKAASFSSQELVGAIQPLMSGLLGTESGAAVARRVAFLCNSSNPSKPPSLSH